MRMHKGTGNSLTRLIMAKIHSAAQTTLHAVRDGRRHAMRHGRRQLTNDHPPPFTAISRLCAAANWTAPLTSAAPAEQW